MEIRKAAAALQVCFPMGEGARNREIRGLIEAMDDFGLENGLIITDDETGEIKEGSKKILLRPFWYFALHADLEVE